MYGEDDNKDTIEVMEWRRQEPKADNKMQRRRPSITPSRRNYIAWRQQWRCPPCQKLLPPFFHVDHIVPIHLGGTNSILNLQTLCTECHAAKTMMEAYRRHDVVEEQRSGVSKYWKLGSVFCLDRLSVPSHIATFFTKKRTSIVR